MCSIICYCKPGADSDKLEALFARSEERGPDDTKIEDTGAGLIGFKRLAIMGPTPEGMQPFVQNGSYSACNGELYGFRPVKEELEKKGVLFQSGSDCELLLPLYKQYGTDLFALLDAEFALVLFDAESNSFIAARDPFGIRPLFYGYDADGFICFASEARCLIGLCREILPFPPGHYYQNGVFTCYRDVSSPSEDTIFSEKRPSPFHPENGLLSSPEEGLDSICSNIRNLLTEGVRKRLDADVPLDFLLSGGLDSSLVCAISARILKEPIRTFAIGMEEDAIDLKYARQAAHYIGSIHTEIIISRKDVLNAVEPVISILGTYDITTIRASIGMYLLCKAIHETTDIRVLMTGEISDELFGYKYTDFAPSPEAFQQESKKRVRELYMYDVLRADRCISDNSMEGRVPFGDLAFAEYVMSIDPEKKMNHYGKGKYLLRRAFMDENLLPPELLMREKAAFSDAVGHSMVDDLKEYAEQLYTDKEFAQKAASYSYCPPFTKESLYYREVFERFYPGQAAMIAGYWMPNKDWEGCQVNDPSARVLSNYGDSGK